MIKDRKPRIIFSNDHWITPWDGNVQWSPKTLIDTVAETAAATVDTHMFDFGTGWVPCWRSRIYSFAQHYRWYIEKFGPIPETASERGLVDYLLAGGDALRLFIDSCARFRLIPFVTMRTHNHRHMKNSIFSVNRFLSENPAFRLFDSGYTKGVESRLNWIHPEVREQRLGFVEEISRYPIAGFNYDFMRSPSYFRLDQTTEQERCRIMTGFIGRIREILDDNAPAGFRRLLAVKVPCHLAEHPLLGIDVSRMAKAGVDMFIVSPSFFTQQQTDLRSIADRVAGKGVYLEMTGLTDRLAPGSLVKRKTTAEAFCTTAHLAYARGATGVSMFNFPGDYSFKKDLAGSGREPGAPWEIVPELGDRELLANRPQYYFLARGYGGYAPAFEGSYTQMMMRNARYAPASPLPCRIESAQRVLFRLDMAPPAGGWKEDGRLRVQAREALAGRELTAHLNGAPLVATPEVAAAYESPYTGMLGSSEDYRAWIVPAKLLVDGENRFEITMTEGEPAELFYLDVAME